MAVGIAGSLMGERRLKLHHPSMDLLVVGLLVWFCQGHLTSVASHLGGSRKVQS